MAKPDTDRKPLRATGMTRLFFAAFWVVFCVVMAVWYAQSGRGIYLFWAIVGGLVSAVNTLVYFGTRDVNKHDAPNDKEPPESGR